MSVVRFVRDRKGGVAPLLALCLLPILGAVGAAVDYSRANAARTSLQAALDSALLFAAKGDSEKWQETALASFNAVAAVKDAALEAPTFSLDADGNYVGHAAGSVEARIAGILGKSTIDIAVTSAVRPSADADNSCILTLDKGSPTSNVSLLFGGAPNISMKGCSTRSNTSQNCNGHTGGATLSYASGNSTNCSNPRSYVKPLPDIYEPLAANINKVCGNLSGGVTWTPGTIPSAVKKVDQVSYTEYHVCGTLTLTGTGALTGLTPAADSLIIVENGGIKITNGSDISTVRTTVILTGANTGSNIDFPQGNGQSATLSLSPSISTDNPWRGIALYQDPALTFKVANDWGPGATFRTDGVVYLPYSDITMQGVADSNNYKCTKFVSKSFTTKGSVALSFSQTKEGCEAIGMKQWADIPIHLVM